MTRILDQQHQSNAFYELSALVLSIIRSPPLSIQFPDPCPVVPATHPPRPVSSIRRPPTTPPISAAGFAAFLLGISLALMLCGSVTFFIGFLLMPWVLGSAIIFYLVGAVSSLSMLGRTIFCPTSSTSLRGSEVPAWKLL